MPVVRSGNRVYRMRPNVVKGQSPEKAHGFRWLWYLYPLLLFTLPNELPLSLLPVAPETVVLFTVVPLAILAEVATQGRSDFFSRLSKVPRTLLLFIFAMVLAWAFSGTPQALEEVIRLSSWAIVCIYAFLLGANRSLLRGMILVWTTVALAASVLLLIQPVKWFQPEVDLLAWEHRTTFGYFLVVPALMALESVLMQRRITVPHLVTLILVVAALVLTFSRGPWLVLMVGAIVLSWLNGRRNLIILMTPAVLVILGLAVTASESQMAMRVRSLWDFSIASSSAYRWDLYSTSFRLLPTLGLFGGGPASSAGLLASATERSYEHMLAGRFQTDSDLLWVLLEAGPVAALLLLAVFAVWSRRLGRLLRTELGWFAKSVALTVFVLAIGFQLLDNTLSNPLGWFIIGFGLGTTQPLSRRERLAASIGP